MKKFKVGIQLYSLRDDMEKDMDATLKAVKDMGYDCVEFAGYFGKTAEEVAALLEKHGLECISVHQAYEVFLDKPEENVRYLKTIGAKYCAIPWMDKNKHKGNDKFEQTVKEIAQVGALLKENGIQLLFTTMILSSTSMRASSFLTGFTKQSPRICSSRRLTPVGYTMRELTPASILKSTAAE